jgi:hypothetical protein
MPVPVIPMNSLRLNVPVFAFGSSFFGSGSISLRSTLDIKSSLDACLTSIALVFRGGFGREDFRLEHSFPSPSLPARHEGLLIEIARFHTGVWINS